MALERDLPEPMDDRSVLVVSSVAFLFNGRPRRGLLPYVGGALEANPVVKLAAKIVLLWRNVVVGRRGGHDFSGMVWSRSPVSGGAADSGDYGDAI